MMQCFMTGRSFFNPSSANQQNDQTQSNNSSANLFDHFVGLALEWLRWK